jgi:hypothetical protein
MSFNGSGVFERLYSWVNDAAANIKIRADRMDNEMNGFATGLSTCITKNGQTTITANLPMAGFRHTGVGNAASRTDYASFAQVQDGNSAWVAAGGTADAITANYSIPITTLIDGQMCFVRASAANATTTPTFSPSSLTARTIVKEGGAALVAGDIAGAGAELILRYNLANTRWELLNPKAPTPPAAGAPYTAPTTTVGASIALAEGTTNGTNTASFKAGDNLASNITLTATVAGNIVTEAGTQTLDNKTLNQPNIVGVTDGSNAAAGSVGEFVSSTVLTGAAVSLTTGTTANVTSISLTAGDWDIRGVVALNKGSTTSVTTEAAAITTVSATYPALGLTNSALIRNQATTYNGTTAGAVIPVGVTRLNITSTTTVYLVANCTFTVSTMSAYGAIEARRVG